MMQEKFLTVKNVEQSIKWLLLCALIKLANRGRDTAVSTVG